MLGHRLRRWPNINPTLIQRLMFLRHPPPPDTHTTITTDHTTQSFTISLSVWCEAAAHQPASVAASVYVFFSVLVDVMRELSNHRMLLRSKTYEGGSAYITLLSGVLLNMILILFVLFHIWEGNEYFLCCQML